MAIRNGAVLQDISFYYWPIARSVGFREPLNLHVHLCPRCSACGPASAATRRGSYQFQPRWDFASLSTPVTRDSAQCKPRLLSGY